MKVEFKSLNKHGVLTPYLKHQRVPPITLNWMFVRKKNERNKVKRYKSQLVPPEFPQGYDNDYEETHLLVIDVITFRYLVNLVASQYLDTRLVDVVTTNLYRDLDTKSRAHHSIKLT